MTRHRYIKRPSREKLLRFFKVKELPDQNNIAEIRDFVTNWFKTAKNVGDHSINCGYCFIWAYLVWALAKPRTVTFHSDNGHVCVKHGGLYYDSVRFAYKSSADIIRVGGYGNPIWRWSMTDVALYWGRNGIRKHVFRQAIRKLSGIRWTDLLGTNKAIRGDVDAISAW